MKIAELRHQIDRDHEQRAQYPNAIGTPKRHRIRKLRYKLRSHHVTGQKGNTMAESQKGKKAAAEKKAEKEVKWGSKDMAKALKIDAKRLRTILRAEGKGVAAGGEAGRYEWKPNDQDAIAKLRKIVDTFEAKAAAKKEETAKKKTAPASKKKAAAAKKSTAKKKSSSKKKSSTPAKEEPPAAEESTEEVEDEAGEEIGDETGEDEETFEEGEEMEG